MIAEMNVYRIHIAIAVSSLVLMLTSCQTLQKEKAMGTMADRTAILKVIDNYTAAMEKGDPALWEMLFWLDDADFTVVENDRPYLLDRKYIDSLTSLIRERGPQPGNQKWYDTQVHFISPEIAYTTSLRDEINTSRTSRVTLIFKKKDGQWRIVHGHFSFVPE